ncbi:DUF805 domain-containing protein [Kocuria sp. p3-SID1433]|uniref:DUF805 domain-containing protein n=1 Tax=unclassified Kocuria TaxID=2649579 RepID=UPI0021A26091|nr:MULTISPECIES: DUF805 domain-containing protein [unclassified Kocuria]MCT1602793.1 DUF805 domain-containing protein [Kocuria sp. p3-SID1428]MCT2180743.1 DUF805 domain-containing protein [Kocuria sp. p3-SID1433]
MGLGSVMKDYFKKYVQFSGRASRSQYWWVCVGLALAVVMLFYGLLLLFGLATIVPSIAITVRRLHDTDRSGWWYFISCVPCVGGIILLVFTLMPSDPRGARFGA